MEFQNKTKIRIILIVLRLIHFSGGITKDDLVTAIQEKLPIEKDQLAKLIQIYLEIGVFLRIHP